MTRDLTENVVTLEFKVGDDSNTYYLKPDLPVLAGNIPGPPPVEFLAQLVRDDWVRLILPEVRTVLVRDVENQREGAITGVAFVPNASANTRTIDVTIQYKSKVSGYGDFLVGVTACPGTVTGGAQTRTLKSYESSTIQIELFNPDGFQDGDTCKVVLATPRGRLWAECVMDIFDDNPPAACITSP